MITNTLASWNKKHSVPEYKLIDDLLIENRLKDFTDPLGTLRFNFLLKQHAIETPYLYKATHNNGAEITILGSFHSMPFRALPEELKSFLLSFDVLMSEGLKQEVYDELTCEALPQEESNDEEEISDNEEEIGNREFVGWFDNMPLRIQQDLDAVFSTVCTNEEAQDLLQSNDLLTSFGNYASLAYEDGMDNELLSSYANRSLQSVRPLEGDDDYQEAIMDGNEWINTYSYDSVMEMIISDHYDSNIANGGAKMDNWQSLQEYCSHSGAEEEYDHNVAKRNKIWMKNIQKCVAENDTGSKLLVAGVAHMQGKGSILELLTESGFTIQSLDLSGMPVDAHEEAVIIGDQEG